MHRFTNQASSCKCSSYNQVSNRISTQQEAGGRKKKRGGGEHTPPYRSDHRGCYPAQRTIHISQYTSINVLVAVKTYVSRAAGSATLKAANAAGLAGGALLKLGAGEGVASQEGDCEGEDGRELHFACRKRNLRIRCLKFWCCLEDWN